MQFKSPKCYGNALNFTPQCLIKLGLRTWSQGSSFITKIWRIYQINEIENNDFLPEYAIFIKLISYKYLTINDFLSVSCPSGKTLSANKKSIACNIY